MYGCCWEDSQHPPPAWHPNSSPRRYTYLCVDNSYIHCVECIANLVNATTSQPCHNHVNLFVWPWISIFRALDFTFQEQTALDGDKSMGAWWHDTPNIHPGVPWSHDHSTLPFTLSFSTSITHSVLYMTFHIPYCVWLIAFHEKCFSLIIARYAPANKKRFRSIFSV